MQTFFRCHNKFEKKSPSSPLQTLPTPLVSPAQKLIGSSIEKSSERSNSPTNCIYKNPIFTDRIRVVENKADVFW